MSEHIIWASEAPEADVQAPSADKQKQGWVAETPPHEWFNWYMNRTDKRLSELEDPRLTYTYVSPAGTRNAVIQAGEKTVLPKRYIVGAGNLVVYLDGKRCVEGANGQYVEAGAPGTESDYIRWNVDVQPDQDIYAEIILTGADRTRVLAESVSLQDIQDALKDLISRSLFNAAVVGSRVDSLPNTRGGVIARNEEFNVPGYTVGTGMLCVYLDGQLLSAGLEYDEVGTPNTNSTSISWKIAVDEGSTITAWSRGVGAARQESLGNTRPAEIAKGDAFNVPQYRVGENQLSVYLDGQLLTPGVDYDENGQASTLSTSIHWKVTVPVTSTITACVAQQQATIQVP